MAKNYSLPPGELKKNACIFRQSSIQKPKNIPFLASKLREEI